MRASHAMPSRAGLALAALFVASTALADDRGLSPSTQTAKIYEIWISTSKTCENPIPVFRDPNATPKDILTSPTFGSGSVPDGTYECIIAVMSDEVAFVPSSTSTSGHCVQGTTYTGHFCRGGTTSRGLDGSETLCKDGVENRITAYLSTAGTPLDRIRDPGHPPVSATDDAHGVKIERAFVVAGDKDLTFFNDATGVVHDTGTTCELGATKTGFR